MSWDNCKVHENHIYLNGTLEAWLEFEKKKNKLLRDIETHGNSGKKGFQKKAKSIWTSFFGGGGS